MIYTLLRVGISPVAWEEKRVDDILRLDFRPKADGSHLRPSVYEVQAPDQLALRASAIRAYAEHVSSFLRPPHKGAPNFDVSGLVGNQVTTPGKTAFVFANNAHRELILDDEDQLRDLITRLLVDRAARRIDITQNDMLGHVRDSANSMEWVAASHTNPLVAKWIAFARKKPASP